jgi:hypothetical protein
MPANDIESGPFGLFFASGDQIVHATRLLRVEDRHLNELNKVTEQAHGLRYQSGYLIAQTDEGAQLLDVSNPGAPKLLGTLPHAGAMLPDVPHGRVWSLNIGDEVHAAELTVHDLKNLTLTSTTYLDAALGYPHDLVRTQSGCFAYVSSTYDATTLVVFAPPK